MPTAIPRAFRLMSIPGIGPIISSAMVAAIGTGDGFSKGRDFALAGAGAPGGSPLEIALLSAASQTWQSLSARPIRASSLGHACEGEPEQMARPRAQALDRSRQEATAP